MPRNDAGRDAATARPARARPRPSKCEKVLYERGSSKILVRTRVA